MYQLFHTFLALIAIALMACSKTDPNESKPVSSGEDSLSSTIHRITASLDAEAKVSGETSIATEVPIPKDDIAEWKIYRNDADYKHRGETITWTVYVTYVPSDPYANIEGSVGSSYSGYDVIIHGKNEHPYNTSYTLNELPRVRKGDKITVTGTFSGIANDGTVNIKATKVINHGVE
jgi:hypothetical protein